MNGKDKLYRSRSKKVLGGVCGGLGEYLNIDPVILRVLLIIFAIFHGIGVLLYIILWIVVPEEQYENAFTVETENGTQSNNADTVSDKKEVKVEERAGKGRAIAGVVLIALGMLFLAEEWFPYFDFEDLFPAILIIGGGLLVFSSIKRNRGQQ